MDFDVLEKKELNDNENVGKAIAEIRAMKDGK